MALKKVGNGGTKLKVVGGKKSLKKTVPKSDEVKENKYSDLRDVIDMSRDFSIFYSGVENQAYFKGCYDMGVRNFLMSFEYIQNKHLSNISSEYPDIDVNGVFSS